MRVLKLGILTALVGLALYIRFVPASPEQWHALPEAIEAEDQNDGAIRMVEADPAELEQLHVIILETKRTRVIAGAVDQNMITYETRSLIMGFPDYTTVGHRDGSLIIYARQRFGRSDFGVNAARIDAWLERFTQGR